MYWEICVSIGLGLVAICFGSVSIGFEVVSIGFEIVSIAPGGIIYSGNAIFGSRLSISFRRRLSVILGGSTYYILVEKLS